ncbi:MULTISPECIES: DUF5665 domain-containing protein [unclassified Paenibacillus]|uniref:DUF5665 domain-containing protein n=1 Tax=unclassified Paenibacillus TaxID=185978 RepID=UPI000AA38566|nr:MULTISPECIES: DUF5665 domain-containing protein [unclassified Paenibacillus]
MEGREGDKHRFGRSGRISIRTSEAGRSSNGIKENPYDIPQEEKLNAIYRLTSGLVQQMEKARIAEYTQLLNSPWRLIWLNVLSGTARGLGIALGFTFFAATIIYVLQVLGALNLPIIGDYIADIVRIVQHQLELKTF